MNRYLQALYELESKPKNKGLVYLNPSFKSSALPKERITVLCGSFNPLHVGHKRLLEVGAKSSPSTLKTYEFSIENPDKPKLPPNDLVHIIKQFVGLNLVLTNAPLFIDKVKLIRGANFVLGSDTAERLLDIRYYKNKELGVIETLEAIKESKSKVLVANRKLKNRSYNFSDLAIPKGYLDLFFEIKKEEFFCDLSSTKLRQP